MSVEGDERTHFCVQHEYAAIVPVLLLLSGIYLLYAFNYNPNEEEGEK